ncbi:hypothetical protein K501DRAFT_101117 [Backusella circina FSU 941]|nr:hypothetical protein K501DRAFT_4697 [Backusella circina FSU 941]KAI8882329.1 hypothetical protein K501DRAFT_101117 [Backusella circina FSU 941]
MRLLWYSAKLRCLREMSTLSKMFLKAQYGPEQIARFIHILQETGATVGFQKNCVFIDEVGFHSQLRRGRAWSKVDTPANVKVHTQKDVNLSMIGCIYARGIISFTKVIPLKIGNAELIEKEFHSEALEEIL